MPELRAALRRLRQSPTFAVFSIVTLALGIGVTTAAYSAIYALVARPHGIADSDRLVFLTRTSATYSTPATWTATGAPARVSISDLRELTAQQRSFDRVASWTRLGGALTGGGSSQLVTLEAVTGNYFDTLGVATVMGRPISAADDRPDAAPVIVLADSAWRSQFHADPLVIGSVVKIAGQSVEVVGVTAPGFRGAYETLVGGRAGWIPLSFLTRAGGRGDEGLTVVGRLASSVAVESARTEIATIGGRLDQAAPLPPRPPTAPGAPRLPDRRGWAVAPLDDVRDAQFSGDATRLILALPALVLLVACSNLANLVLSRGASRRHEFAVRASLGASRARLVRQEMIETTIIALAGGLGGVAVTDALLSWAVSELREPLGAVLPQVALTWRLEPAVFAAAGAAVLLTLIVAGLIPALQLTRPNPGRSLTGEAALMVPRWRGRSNLIALQVTVSVALFLLSVIAVRVILDPPVRERRIGVDLSRLGVASLPFGVQHIGQPRAIATLERVLDELRQSPDVETAAAATRLPFRLEGLFSESPYQSVTHPERPFTATHAGTFVGQHGVSPEFFQAVGMSVTHGRAFDHRDGPGAPPVVILNASFAREVFGSVNATGRTILVREYRYSRGVRGPIATPIESATVVGIVPDSGRSSTGHAETSLYVPLAQHYAPQVILVARARGDDARLVPAAMRAAIRRADPELAIFAPVRADLLAGVEFLFLNFVATATVGFATLTLVLAMGGLYGVLVHVVAKRTREMGVRMALGAEPGRIVRLVLKDGLRPVAEGAFVGLAVAFVIRQLLQRTMTEELSALDVATFSLALVPMLVAGFVAAYLPARRASRVNPNVALREL